MSESLEEFRRRLNSDWLPSYCSEPRRNYSPEGFRRDSLNALEAFDAGWFIQAIDGDLVKYENGGFRAPLSSGAEPIFWELEKSISPRPITLWREPVITIGAVARLKVEFGWPIGALGMQSRRSWAFDLVGYDADGLREILLCEVKKSDREIEMLHAWMLEYCSSDPLEAEPEHKGRKNAYRKVRDIRIAWPQLVWLLGPGGRGVVFKVTRENDSLRFNLIPVSENNLGHRNFVSAS
ncbi:MULTISPECIES: hypothetical protein [Hyphomonas]|uniref:hypothetical protein n=1 Tax=Hyphomonas TaxID=85 RepID=UPI0011D03E35|nr:MULTISPECIES: hypothetical protein [Hyphomonas]